MGLLQISFLGEAFDLESWHPVGLHPLTYLVTKVATVAASGDFSPFSKLLTSLGTQWCGPFSCSFFLVSCVPHRHSLKVGRNYVFTKAS